MLRRNPKAVEQISKGIYWEWAQRVPPKLLHTCAKGLVLLVMLVCGHPAICQHPASRQYRVLVHQTVGGASPKSMMVVMDEWIGAADLDHDKDNRTLLFTSAATFHLEELRERLAPAGYRVLGFTGSRLNGEAQDLQEGMAPYPVFIDTGNELEDHARFDHAKAAWVAAWPQEYERMISTRLKDQAE